MAQMQKQIAIKAASPYGLTIGVGVIEEDDPRVRDPRVRDVATVSVDKRIFDDAWRVQVNWSAWGAQEVATAREFAMLLTAAANIGRACEDRVDQIKAAAAEGNREAMVRIGEDIIEEYCTVAALLL